jgi:hypothetical protein
MNPEQIAVIAGHKEWVESLGERGSRANLSRANLSRANLSDADLSRANLSDANLSRANLSDANLSRANLSDADLSDANLSDADLSDADLSDANLSDADLRGADLRGADLSDADLRGANLRGADLRGADLRGVKNMATLFAARTSIVPQVGVYEAWKKCKNGVIVRLLIPAEARRSNATGRKCRAEFVDVLEIFGEAAISMHDSAVTYEVGQRVTCHKWEEDRWIECAGGIHHFITREEAEDYD